MSDDDPDGDPFEDVLDALRELTDELFAGRPVDDGLGRREVRADVHAREERIEVVADLPGAAAEELELWCDGLTLRIELGDVVERIELPSAVDATTAEASFNNGVLSVAFEPADDDGATVDAA